MRRDECPLRVPDYVGLCGCGVMGAGGGRGMVGLGIRGTGEIGRKGQRDERLEVREVGRRGWVPGTWTRSLRNGKPRQTGSQATSYKNRKRSKLLLFLILETSDGVDILQVIRHFSNAPFNREIWLKFN